jgi:NADPH:quinone reductase-like Zn-dependent oxidoreductase
MRAMVVRRYGPPKVLESQQVPDLPPKPGEVLIRVKTVGVNFADLLQRMGLYPGTPKPPFVPGIEIAGIVEKAAAGEKTPPGDSVRQGDAVVAFTQFNAYAEWVTVPANRVFRIPPGIHFEDAAAIPVNYLTAYHSILTMGNLQPADRILIHGAAGGVGIAAVQLARARGLVIFGTAGSAKQEFLRKIGVDHPIDYEKTDFTQVIKKFAPDGIEMVMDPVGGKSYSQSFDCLGPTGRLVIYGFSVAAASSGRRNWLRSLKAIVQTPWFHPLKLMGKNVAVMGVNISRMPTRGPYMQNVMNEIFRIYAAGTIKPVIAKSFPLAQAAEAHQYIHDRKNIGKVILTVK